MFAFIRDDTRGYRKICLSPKMRFACWKIFPWLLRLNAWNIKRNFLSESFWNCLMMQKRCIWVWIPVSDFFDLMVIKWLLFIGLLAQLWLLFAVHWMKLYSMFLVLAVKRLLTGRVVMIYLKYIARREKLLLTELKINLQVCYWLISAKTFDQWMQIKWMLQNLVECQ